MLAELGRGAVGDDSALVDDDGAGAGGIHFLQDVGGKENGFGLAKTGDEFSDFVFLVGIESIGGFIEDEDLWVVE